MEKGRAGKVLRRVAIVVAALVCAVLVVLAYWLVRPNTARVDPSLGVETWVAVGDGDHHFNTDLIYLSDLPSCGDTSYTGVVIRGGDVYVSYYTNDVHTDYPWILGMVRPSDIRIAKIPLARLHD